MREQVCAEEEMTMPEREMTLREWVEQLSECHRARYELDELVEGMEKAVECKKCAADKALDEALDKVFEKVSAMSKAEFDDMIEKHKDGDMAQLLNHSGMFDCYDVHEERDKMEKALRDVLAIGYNKDCMFCGFKDKIALQATGHSEAD